MPDQKKTTRSTSGWKQVLLAILSLVGFGIYLVDLYPDWKTEIFSQMSFRLAIVLATLWLAFPQLDQFFKSFSVGILLVVLLIAFVVARNPVILVSIVVLCVILAIMNFAIRVFNDG